MRTVFALMLQYAMRDRPNICLLTADLGYSLFDGIEQAFPERFFDFGSREQLMIGAAAGMAASGKVPVCYSITPFLLYRPFEWIRNCMGKDGLPIKLVGSGRGDEYNLGWTHSGKDARRCLSAVPGVKTFFPTDKTPKAEIAAFLKCRQPCFLSLTR